MLKNNKREKNPILQDDILRYKKNKLAANLALLAIVFNCLYFMILYSVHATKIYTFVVGGSVILNLLVLLIGFFASEGIKGYNKKFTIVLFVLAAVQIARIFVYPTIGMAKGWLKGNFYLGIKMTEALNGVVMIVFLVASAACFILSGIYGYIMAQRLEKFTKKIESGELSVEETLKELDKAEKSSEEVVVKEQVDTEVVETVDSEEVDNG
ncbi:MAG: hypothetical protein K2K04_02310 [Clostridia bacterium]|nr:hypothetical protein [Clostridia bacterium]